MYPQRLLDHFQNPRNVGELAPPAITIEASNPACGDIMRLAARFENGVAERLRGGCLPRRTRLDRTDINREDDSCDR